MRLKPWYIVIVTAAHGAAACRDDAIPTDLTLEASTIRATAASSVEITTTIVPNPLVGNQSATGINDLGQVTGSILTSNVPPFLKRPYVWTPGLDPILLEIPVGAGSAEPYDINDAGVIVGGALPVPGFPVSLGAIRWSAMTGQAELVPAFVGTLFSVNELGWAAGSYGILSPSNAITRLPGPSCVGCQAFGAGWDINNLGQVTGSFAPSTAMFLAVLWGPDLSFYDLGAQSGAFTAARGLSETGSLVGRVTVSGVAHAFLWTADSGLVDLGASPFADGCPGLSAQDINERGEVVGASFGAQCDQVPFYWSQATGIVRLPSPPGSEGWSGIARRINNNGEIAGDFVNRAASTQGLAVIWRVAPACTSDPAASITRLLAIVNGWVDQGLLNHGQGNALAAKLTAAASALARGNAPAAAGMLRALLNQLRAFAVAGHLSAADANTALLCTRQLLEAIA